MTTAPPRLSAPAEPAVPTVGLLPASLTVGALAVVLGGVASVAAGPRALTGVLVGTVLVGAFFCLGAWTVGPVAARVPGLALLVALLTYTLQVVLLAVAFAALERSALAGELDRRWLAGTVVAGALAWTAALVAHALRSPSSPSGARPATGPGASEEPVRTGGVGW